jgi:hypothetical protein
MLSLFLGASFRKCFDRLSNQRKAGLRQASLRYGSLLRKEQAQ